MRKRARLAAALTCLALALGGAAAAQEAPEPAPPPQSAILTIDPERLYAQSLWGQRAQAGIEEATAALAAENRRIEADLTSEEGALTARRATMDPAAFRAEADAFDARVVDIRQAQDAKGRDLARRREAERQAFFEAAVPMFGRILRDRGAVAILDVRSIFIAAESIDVTDELQALVDSGLGPGPEGGVRPAPAGETPPEPPGPAPGAGPEPPAAD